MTNVTERSGPASNGSAVRSNGRPVPVGSSPSSTRRPTAGRHTGRIALGVLVLILSALVAVVLFSSATNRVAVIGVARDVPAGQAIEETDLREVLISGGDGLAVISADDASNVVGRIAAVALTAGSLLGTDQLTDGPALPEGTVVTGAVLKPGQYPVGLDIGADVDVIETTPPDVEGAGEPVQRGSGTVLDLSSSDDGQSLMTVSLAVPADDSAAISSAGADGRLSLVVTEP